MVTDTYNNEGEYTHSVHQSYDLVLVRMAGGSGGMGDVLTSIGWSDQNYSGDGHEMGLLYEPTDLPSTLDVFVAGDGSTCEAERVTDNTGAGWNGGGDGGYVYEDQDGEYYLLSGGGGGMSQIKNTGASDENSIAIAGGGAGGGTITIANGYAGDFDKGVGATGDGGYPTGDDGGSVTVFTAESGSLTEPGGAGGTQTDGYVQFQGQEYDSDGGTEYSYGLTGGGGAGWYGGETGIVSSYDYEEYGILTGSGGGSSYMDGTELEYRNLGLRYTSYIEFEYFDVTQPDTLNASTDKETAVDLSWNSTNDPADETFEIYRSSTPGVTAADTLVTTTTDTSYTDTGLTDGRTYYYRIRCDYHGFTSPLSSEFVGSTAHTPYGKVRTADGDVVEITNSKIRINGETVYIEDGHIRQDGSLQDLI